MKLENDYDCLAALRSVKELVNTPIIWYAEEVGHFLREDVQSVDEAIHRLYEIKKYMQSTM